MFQMVMFTLRHPCSRRIRLYLMHCFRMVFVRTKKKHLCSFDTLIHSSRVTLLQDFGIYTALVYPQPSSTLFTTSFLCITVAKMHYKLCTILVIVLTAFEPNPAWIYGWFIHIYRSNPCKFKPFNESLWLYIVCPILNLHYILV